MKKETNTMRKLQKIQSMPRTKKAGAPSQSVKGHQKDLTKVAGSVAGMQAFSKMKEQRAKKGKSMSTAKLGKVVSTVSTARKKAEKQARKSFK